jgi:thiol-disulfide isomerase/thioredoxin
MITAPAVTFALRFLLGWLLTCMMTAGTAGAAEMWQPWNGGPTPALQLKTLDGRTINLADFRGRTVIVNFWATWCAPCVAEMPALQRLRDRMGLQRLEVIAVNFQENAARIRPFVERRRLTYPVVRDHDGAARAAWGVTVFPTSFVVGPDQRIAWVAIGEVDWRDARVELRIRSLQ